MTDTSTALAVAALVPGVFAACAPSLSELRSTQPNPTDRASIETAAAVAVVLVAGIGLAAGDRHIVCIGGLVTLGFALTFLHAHDLP